ncbi:MAG: hypothetical protein DHS20C05_07180 [Hyphococcus sp.]|nr:MAG: hypothetical protein DHS20C05_07180 [Marinicaulis sp.]
MKTLTDILGSMDPRERMERRRRIEAIADWWALKLRQKHGDEAEYRCRHHMVNTVKMGAGLRNHIWSRVYRQLR